MKLMRFGLSPLRNRLRTGSTKLGSVEPVASDSSRCSSRGSALFLAQFGMTSFLGNFLWSLDNSSTTRQRLSLVGCCLPLG